HGGGLVFAGRRSRRPPAPGRGPHRCLRTERARTGGELPAHAVILLLSAALASAAPQIDLYSMGPGDELFSRFGHSAICVENGEKTRCYNYGSTSIEPRRLVVGFVRATAAFEVTRTSLDR